jgi:enoyl-CoA hydratase
VSDPVLVQHHGPVTVLTINRPTRRNAVDGPTAESLRAALDSFEADEDAAALVLTGADGVFCSGADLGALETLFPRLHDPDGPLGVSRRTASKPVLAAVDGWAVAGGFELALWADLRIASPTARFGFLERRFGVPLVDGGTVRLPLIVGLGVALELILTGRVVDVGEARAIGLVNEVTTDPLARAVVLGQQLARFPQPTLRADRRSVYAALDLARGLAAELREGGAVLHEAGRGAARFAAGEGRSGEPLREGRGDG